MASLLRKLQTQSAYPYKSQQPLLFHKYKKPKHLIDPLGLETLPIPFLNQLPLRQSKCSYKCFIKVSAKKLK